MEINELSAAICKTANAILRAHQPSQPAIQEFCITSALGALVDLSTDYGLADIRCHLLDRMGKIKHGQHARPIDEEVMS
jgi:hypothetical protein